MFTTETKRGYKMKNIKKKKIALNVLKETREWTDMEI